MVKNTKKSLKTSNGITLIALVITIIVLLILAGISISMLSGDNSILSRATQAKEKNSKAQEEEAAKLTFTAVQMELMQGKSVDNNTFQSMIDGNFGSNKATGTVGGNNYIITVQRTGENYQMDSSGNIEQIAEIPIDFAPGILEQSGNTYTINSIEDLVAFSYNVNSGTESYAGKTVTLGRDLDFNGSKDSYVDENAKYKKDEFGYTPDNTSTTTIKSFMTDTNGEGFYPVGGKTNDIAFEGNFDGKNKSLSNLFISSEFDNVAFIGQSKSDTIENIKMLNCDVSSSSRGCVAGIVGITQYGNFNNCFVSGKIEATNDSSGPVGGIIGQIAGSPKITITNCYNESNVIGKAYNGGIAGMCTGEILNCYNCGDISGNGYTGGIVGNQGTAINCYNKGNVKSNNTNAGGIIGVTQGTIKNCYNFESVTGGSTVGGIRGTSGGITDHCFNSGTIKIIHPSPVGGIVSTGGNITNCHNIGTIIGENSSLVGEITGANTVDETNDFLLKTDNDGNNINANANGAKGKTQAEMDEIMSVQNFVNLMNKYVSENNADSSKTKLKTWKLENGFPVFAE